MMRLPRGIAVAATALVLATPPVLSAYADDAIPIGVLLPFTGSMSHDGEKAMRGMKLALEEVNAISGRKFTLVAEDDESTPQGGMDGIHKLVDVDKVAVVLGTLTSSDTIPTAKYAISMGVPQIGVTATSPDIRTIGKGFFSVVASDEVLGQAVANFAMEDSGKKRAAILVSNEPYGVGIGNQMRKAVEKAGGEVVSEVRYELGKQDYRAELARLFGPKPDIILTVSWAETARLLTKQSYELGYLKDLSGGWYQSSPSELAHACIPEACEGMKGLEFSTDTASRFSEMKAKLDQTGQGGEIVDWVTAVAYDSVWIAALAIDIAGTTDHTAVTAALPIAFKIYRGASDFDMSVDADGVQTNQVLGAFEVRGGKLVPYAKK